MNKKIKITINNFYNFCHRIDERLKNVKELGREQASCLSPYKPLFLLDSSWAFLETLYWDREGWKCNETCEVSATILGIWWCRDSTSYWEKYPTCVRSGASRTARHLESSQRCVSNIKMLTTILFHLIYMKFCFNLK